MLADKPVAEAFEAFAGAAPHAAGAVARWTRGGLAVAVAATKKRAPSGHGCKQAVGTRGKQPVWREFQNNKKAIQ